MDSLVYFESPFVCKRLDTEAAAVGFFPSVGPQVPYKVANPREGLVTVTAHVWFLSSMRRPVFCKGTPVCEGLSAAIASVGSLFGVDLPLVFSKVTFVRKGSVALVTGVRFFSNVDSLVYYEDAFVCKCLTTNVAVVGFFSSVGP